jgi:hypothetical protein
MQIVHQGEHQKKRIEIPLPPLARDYFLSFF